MATPRARTYVKFNPSKGWSRARFGWNYSCQWSPMAPAATDVSFPMATDKEVLPCDYG